MRYRSDREKPTTTVTYGDVEIEYFESDNQWTFVLRGRERTVPSLTAAKEAIDKPVAGKKPEFKRQSALMIDRYGSRLLKKVEITSLIERGHYVWTVDAAGNRSKQASKLVFLDTEDNVVKFGKWTALKNEVSRLEKEAEAILNSITSATSLIDKVSE